jgi:hypothetical protein
MRGETMDTNEVRPNDYYLWTQQQLAALREVARTSNANVDWDEVIEEIEDLGKRERRSLESHIGTVIEHLLKLRFSPAPEPRRGWVETVLRTQYSIAKILRDSPSLQREVPAMIVGETGVQVEIVIDMLRSFDELDAKLEATIRASRFSETDVLKWKP